MEWLAANWFWVGLGNGAVWLFLRGWMGCGMGRHRAHGTEGASRSTNGEATRHGAAANGYGTAVGQQTGETGVPARFRAQPRGRSIARITIRIAAPRRMRDRERLPFPDRGRDGASGQCFCVERTAPRIGRNWHQAQLK